MNHVTREISAELQNLGVGSRFVVIEIENGALCVHYIGSKRQGYSQFVDVFEEDKCMFGGFAFEEMGTRVDAEEDPLPVYKHILVSWTGKAALPEDRAVLQAAEEEVGTVLGNSGVPIALRLPASQKADLDYCAVVDRMAPPEDEEEEEEEEEYGVDFCHVCNKNLCCSGCHGGRCVFCDLTICQNCKHSCKPRWLECSKCNNKACPEHSNTVLDWLVCCDEACWSCVCDDCVTTEEEASVCGVCAKWLCSDEACASADVDGCNDCGRRLCGECSFTNYSCLACQERTGSRKKKGGSASKPASGSTASSAGASAASAPAVASGPGVPVGSVVILRGLRSAEHLNGTRAKVTSPVNKETGRQQAVVASTGKQVAVKPENLEVVSAVDLASVHTLGTCASVLCVKTALFRCSSCLVATYCGPECQRGDWPSHRTECREHARLHHVVLDLSNPTLFQRLNTSTEQPRGKGSRGRVAGDTFAVKVHTVASSSHVVVVDEGGAFVCIVPPGHPGNDRLLSVCRGAVSSVFVMAVATEASVHQVVLDCSVILPRTI